MTAASDESPAGAEQEVNYLFDFPELTRAIETEEFRVFLDQIPIAIVISKVVRGEQRIAAQ